MADVAGIGQDEVRPLKTPLGQLLQGRLAANPVVFVGRPDISGPEQAADVDDELALAALDLL
ncbi:hypothetical protein HNP98_001542 [Hymenobacter sp. 9A]|uniref:Uncharacterized protein n=1 Tax=Hymenobacter caeli TaxID=2735894 RepID=A0ABX2FNG9_9BACT|nr:hypothetical protein [Hymenobacter caeli]NRT18721.1 hypothetical protein [Hymenobacter caeli]